VVSDFSRGSFVNAILNRTDMRSSDFIGGNFQGADASTGPTTLGRIDFTFGWTNFFGANFRSANLGSFDIRGDWIVGAGTCHTTMPDGHQNNRNC
jgi:uncharacterized protein YjbI with pentapeptide repeats